MTCGQSSGCTGECKSAPFICPNYTRVETELFHAEELGWQCIDKEANAWESPTGERRMWPQGKSPTFQRIKGAAR